MKRFVTFLLTFALVFALVQIPVQAAWQQSGGKWYYTDGSGSKVTGWKQIGGTWYYFDSQGVMKTGWLLYGKDWYYLHSSGAMATGIVTIGGAKHQFNSSGVWQGEVESAKTGWVQEGGKWYYYQTGVKVTGWKLVGKVWYFFNGQGVMQTGWLLYGKDWYYLQSSGAMATGIVTIGGVKHQFNASGIWQGQVQTAKNGWLQEGGKWYYYKNDVKATGWLLYGGDWYYLKATGEMTTGWLLYGKAWYYLQSSGVMATGWLELGADKYYFYPESGVMATDAIIDGWIIGSDGKAQEPQQEPDPEPAPTGGTVTIGIPAKAVVEDYDTNTLTLWLEEQTGYDIEFVEYYGTNSDIKAQINTQIAAQESLPDIILGVDLGASVAQRFGQDGYFADLMPYLLDTDGAARSFWDRMEQSLTQEERDYVMRSIYSPADNAVYALPAVTVEGFNTSCMAWINTQWLDALEMEMPTSMQELYDVLVAFKENDPNGNGVHDEIPLLGADKVSGGKINQWLINMFLYYDENSLWQPDTNGQLQPVFTQDSYRQAMMYVNKLVDEDLLSSLSYSLGTADMRSLLSASTPIVGVMVCDLSLMAQTGVSSQTLYQYEPMINWGYTVENDISCKVNTFVSQNDNVAASFKVLMTLFSEEGTLRMRYGQKGTDWTNEDVWGDSYSGAVPKVEILNNVQSGANNNWWGFTACGIYDYDGALAAKAECETDEDYWLMENLNRGAKYIIFGVHNDTPETVCPTLLSDDLYIAQTQVKTVVSQMQMKFATGQMDPNNDSDWQAYLQALADAGLETATAATQEAYNAQVNCLGQEHQFANASCTQAKKCILCGLTEGQALGHNYGAEKCSRCDEAVPTFTNIWWGTVTEGEGQIAMPKFRFGEDGSCDMSISYYEPVTKDTLDYYCYYDWYWIRGRIYGRLTSGTGRDGTYTVSGDTVTMDFYGTKIVLTKTSADSYTVTSADGYVDTGLVLTVQ